MPTIIFYNFQPLTMSTTRKSNCIITKGVHVCTTRVLLYLKNYGLAEAHNKNSETFSINVYPLKIVIYTNKKHRPWLYYQASVFFNLNGGKTVRLDLQV
jgi:hypothetical protein